MSVGTPRGWGGGRDLVGIWAAEGGGTLWGGGVGATGRMGAAGRALQAPCGECFECSCMTLCMMLKIWGGETARRVLCVHV